MHITDLPVELLLDHLLPALPVHDLLSLTNTSKFFASICNDDILWKLKLKREFNFTANADTARESGFKVIYRGLRKPSVYTWGSSSQSRLGLSSMPRGVDQRSSGVPFPAQVEINARIVSLAAGGWSFHALDDQGFIHVWGQLHGESFAMRADGFSEPAKTAKTPHKLLVTPPPSSDSIGQEETAANPAPIKFTGVSTGRAHSAALPSTNHVWVFKSWGRPALLTSDLLDPKLGPGSKVIQVESGWSNVAMLTSAGEVLVLWPDGSVDDFQQQFTAKDRELNRLGKDHPSSAKANEDKVVACYSIEIPAAPLRLPPLPSELPVLEDDRNPTQLVRIAAGDEFLIGLTNKGHVLSINLRTPGGATWLKNQFSIGRVAWKYLPEYSEIDKIKAHPTWATSPSEISPTRPASPEGPLQITHISAHFKTFVAYSISPSVVLMGQLDDSVPEGNAVDFTCTIVQALQTRPPEDPIISVVLGDYHFVALTAQGRVLSWGKYSSGALGLGDPRELEVGAPGGFARIEEKGMAIGGRFNEPNEEVTVPTEVKWDWDPSAKGKKFCFAVTASGWHTGALAIDLEHPEQEEGSKIWGAGGEMEVTDAEQFTRWSQDQEPYPQPQIDGGEPGHDTRESQPPGSYPDEGDGISTYESPPFNPNANSGRGGRTFPMSIRPMPGQRGRAILPGIGGPSAGLPFRVGFAGRGAYRGGRGGGDDGVPGSGSGDGNADSSTQQ